MRRPFLLLASLALGACSHTAIQQAQQESRLIDDMAQASMAEIAAGNLAVTRGESAAVRQLGERIGEDHRSLLRAASGLAASRGTSIPASPGPAYRASLKELRSLSGAAFDRAFLGQTGTQQQLLRLLREAAGRSGDPAIRAHAARALSRVEQHRLAARRLTDARTSAASLFP